MKATIERIHQMETYFDILLQACSTAPQSIFQDDSLREIFRTLIDYYEGGQWMRDYEADEQGLLPPDLKRGVLSEDGVYNLLSDIESARS